MSYLWSMLVLWDHTLPFKRALGDINGERYS